MRPRLTAVVVAGLMSCAIPAARAQRVNKMPVRHAEAALALDTGVLKIRLTLETGQALDYEVRDEPLLTRVLKFLEISADGRTGLAAEIATDGHTLRALHLVPPELRPRR